VVVGGAASIAIAGLWMRWFPGLRALDRFPKLYVHPESGAGQP
jgi:hypothetical protein